MCYKYGLKKHCYPLPTIRDFPTKEDNRPIAIKIALPNDTYTAYAYYSRSISIVDEHVYGLEYLGREKNVD